MAEGIDELDASQTATAPSGRAGWRSLLGNRLLLGALLTTEPLVDDEPVAFDPCGQCRRCLNACPTGALDRPHHLDARRCLSYWTIEQAGPIPREWETLLGDCVFGCDRCQDACPWSHVGRGNDLKSTSLVPLREDLRRLDLIELLSLDNDAFQRRFSGTPITRAGRNGLLRSVALVLGARLRRAFDDEIAAVLCRGLNDPSAVVRQACAAALCWCDRSEIRAVLSERLAVEEDERVRAALSRHSE